MGLLDDAIREHLELKRRRGADPSEIERLEREALGPVRRAGYDPEEAGYEPDEAAYDPEEAGYGDEPQFEDEPPLSSGYAGQERQRSGEAPRRAAFADHATELYADEQEWEEEPDAIEAGIGVEPDTAAPGIPAPPGPAEARTRQRELSEDDYLDQETLEHEADEGEPHSQERGARGDRGTPADRGRQPELGPERGQPGPERGQPGPEREPAEPGHAPAEHDDMLEETPEFLQDTPDHDRLWFEQRPPRDFDLGG